MATDLERLVVQLSADFKKYENALNKAMGVTNRQARSIERRFQQMNSRLATSFTAAGKRLGAALIAGLSVREIGRFADTAIQIENALKVTGLAGEELSRVYDRLRESAMRNYAPLETLAQLYSRLGLSQKALGVSVDEMVNFTDKVALALRVQGTTAQEAQGALIQLSQAMGAGIVRAEEFNSIVEGAPSILRAAAAGLKEAGGEVSKLRQLVIDGKLSSQAFFRAFEAGAPILDKMVESANVTLSQAFTNLNNALVDTAKEFNEATGAADKFAGGINNVAQAIAGFDTSGFIEEIQKAGGALEKFLNDVGNADIFKRLAIGVGALNEEGLQLNIETEKAKEEAATLEREVKLLQERIEHNTTLGFDNTEAIARLNEVSGRLATLRDQINGMPELADMPGFNFGGPPTRKGKRRVTVLNQVSIEDYAVPDKDKKGSGKSTKERADEYERLSQRIVESTAALVSETEVQRQLNPLVDDYGYAVERARTEQELLNAALAAGKTITPELREQIAALADQYALATVEAAKLAESQDRVRQHAEEMAELQKDVLRGVVDGFIEGKKAADIFADALRKIGNKLLDIAFNNLFNPKMGGFGGGGGLLGGAIIPGILHSGGVAGRDGYGHGRVVSPSVFTGAKRYHKGGVAGLQPGEVPAILQRGEVVLPKGAGVSGGGISVPININIDASGADPAAIQRLESGMAKLRQEIPAQVIESVRKAQKSNVKLG